MKLRVLPTSRRQIIGEYIIQLNKENMDKIRVKKGAYVRLTNQVGKRRFSIMAYVHVPDDKLGCEEIKVDQTLRDAIGIKKGHWINVEQAELKKSFLRKISEKIVRYQNEIVRVEVATRGDMEMRICRIDKEVMDAIAVDMRDYVEIVSWRECIRLRALPLTVKIEKCRMDEIREGKRLNFKKIFKRNFDIPPILIDKEARDELKVKEGDAVIVRREVFHCIFKQLGIISLALLLAFLGISEVLPRPSIPYAVFLLTVVVILLMIYQKRKEII